MKPHWFRILLALAAGDTHGAEIRRRIRADEGPEIYPATLYGSLEDLLAAGHIAEVRPRTRSAAESGRHRDYRITATGRAALAAEGERLEALGRAARRALSSA